MELKKIQVKNKRGQIGLDMVRSVAVGLLILAVIGVAIILALVSLRDSSIFTDGSREDNQTTNIVNNITDGLTDFFSNTGTIFAILVVVVIVLAIVIIIAVVSRVGSRQVTGL